MPIYHSSASSGRSADDLLPRCVRDYLAGGEIPEGDRNNTLFRMTCQCHHAGLFPEEVTELLVARALQDGLSEPEARKTVRSAFASEQRPPPPSTPPRDAAPDSSPGSASSGKASSGACPTSSNAASPSGKKQSKPHPLPSPVAEGFKVLAENCFEPAEKIVIGKGSINGADEKLDIDAGTMNPREVWLRRFAAEPISQAYAGYKDGIFLRINPMSRRGKSDDDVAAWRHCLVEFDRDENGGVIPKEVQYGILLESGMPISAVLDSGNKSLQALVRLDATNRKEYEERLRQVIEYFKEFDGFDAQNKNPSRYCRCPGVERNLYAGGKVIRIVRQELLAVGLGPASWAEYETAPSITEEELREYDRQETSRLLGNKASLPAPMEQAAYYGIAGQIVDIIAADNEPCRESLLGHFLIGMGNLIGSRAWMDQGSEQHLNEFGLFIGPSSIGRKGTAWHLVSCLLKEVDPDWVKRRIRRALQSGEAIIHNIRDASVQTIGKKVIRDPGVADKRLVIMEPEITRFLTIGKRKGNSIFDVANDCWDSLDPLCCDSKNAAEEATHPHVSMIAHGTVSAYLKELPESQKTNGNVNRSLILAVYRAQKKAVPERIRWRRTYPDIIRALQNVTVTFAIERQIDWSPEARADWEKFYHSFEPKTKGGMISSILDRIPTHVVRIAMLYCVLDNSTLITGAHLRAALAFCDYCRRSAEWLFGVKTGDRSADRLYGALVRHKPKGMTRTEISEAVFNKNVAKAYLDELLGLLLGAELVCMRSETNPRKGPRTIDKWYAC